jgi:hypothetical protein
MGDAGYPPASKLNLDFACAGWSVPERSDASRTIRGNLGLVAFVTGFDENNKHARDEHP